MDKVPEEKKKKKEDAPTFQWLFFELFVWFWEPVECVGWTAQTQISRGLSAVAPELLSNAEMSYWQLTKDMGRIHTKQSVHQRNLNV